MRDDSVMVYGLHQAAALLVAGHQLLHAHPCADDPGRWAFEFPPSAAQDLALYSDRRLHGNLSDLFHARKLLLRLARQETSVKSIGKWSRKERDGGRE